MFGSLSKAASFLKKKAMGGFKGLLLKQLKKKLASPKMIASLVKMASKSVKLWDKVPKKACYGFGNMIGARLEIVRQRFKWVKSGHHGRFLQHTSTAVEVTGDIQYLEPCSKTSTSLCTVGVSNGKGTRIIGRATDHSAMLYRKHGWVNDNTGAALSKVGATCNIRVHVQNSYCTGCCCKSGLSKVKVWTEFASKGASMCREGLSRSKNCPRWCAWNMKDKCFKRCAKSKERRGESCRIGTACGYVLGYLDLATTVIARIISFTKSTGERSNGLIDRSAHCFGRSSSKFINWCCNEMN